VRRDRWTTKGGCTCGLQVSCARKLACDVGRHVRVGVQVQSWNTATTSASLGMCLRAAEAAERPRCPRSAQTGPSRCAEYRTMASGPPRGWTNPASCSSPAPFESAPQVSNTLCCSGSAVPVTPATSLLVSLNGPHADTVHTVCMYVYVTLHIGRIRMDIDNPGVTWDSRQNPARHPTLVCCDWNPHDQHPASSIDPPSSATCSLSWKHCTVVRRRRHARCADH
jgi:hypothetical protein